MAKSWMEAVGPSVVTALAKECSVQLTPHLIRFLDLYGEQVDAIGRSRALTHRRAAKMRQELTEVYDFVREEVEDFRETQRTHDPEIELLQVIRQAETYLPVIHCRLRALPMMVVHVKRTYESRKVLASCAFKLQEYSGGKLTGQVHSAVNYVRTLCRERQYQLTVSEVLNIWFTSGLGVPLRTREAAMAAKDTPSKEAPAESDDKTVSKEKSPATPQSPKSNSIVEAASSDDSSNLSGSSPRKVICKKKRKPSVRLAKDVAISPKARKKSLERTSPVVSQPLVQDSPGVRPRLSGRALHFEPVGHLPPTSTAELKAGVNAALSKIDTSKTAVQEQTNTLHHVVAESGAGFPQQTFHNGYDGLIDTTTSGGYVKPSGSHGGGGVVADDSFADGRYLLGAAPEMVACDTVTLGRYDADVFTADYDEVVDASICKLVQKDCLPSPEVEVVMAVGGGDKWMGSEKMVDVDMTSKPKGREEYNVNFFGRPPDGEEEIIASGGRDDLTVDDLKDLDLEGPEVNEDW